MTSFTCLLQRPSARAVTKVVLPATLHWSMVVFLVDLVLQTIMEESAQRYAQVLHTWISANMSATCATSSVKHVPVLRNTIVLVARMGSVWSSIHLSLICRIWTPVHVKEIAYQTLSILDLFRMNVDHAISLVKLVVHIRVTHVLTATKDTTK